MFLVLLALLMPLDACDPQYRVAWEDGTPWCIVATEPVLAWPAFAEYFKNQDAQKPLLTCSPLREYHVEEWGQVWCIVNELSEFEIN